MTDSQKYSSCQLWKWNIVLFELSLTSQTAIFLYYFVTDMYNQWLKHSNNPTFAQKMLINLSHIAPVCILVLEYICFSTTPIIPRHFVCSFLFCNAYIITNITVTKVSGKMIYPGFHWNSWVDSILLILGLNFANMIVFFFFVYLTKLLHNKNSLIRDIIFKTGGIRESQ